MRRVEIGQLTALVTAALAANDVSAENAAIVADAIVAAERDDCRSHGLFRMRGYVETLRSGWIDGGARPQVADTAPGVVSVDGRNGFAQVALAAGRPLLLEKVRRVGIASLAIGNAHHFAALWPDVEPFAEAGLVALAFVNSRIRVAPFDAGRKVLGTNPMAFACPRADGPPFVWDQASSAVANGEVLLAAQEGRALPPDAALDSAGRPTTDPRAVIDGGMFLPFGGHKGAAIATMIEILAAAVTGGAFGFEDRSALFPGAQTFNGGELVLVIDPARHGAHDFAARVEALVGQLYDAGAKRLPGNRRRAARARAEREGIAVDDATYAYLVSLARPG